MLHLKKGIIYIKKKPRIVEDYIRVCVRFPGIPVRFSGGYSNVEGRVEVFLNNIWGTICDAGWDSLDSRVVCQTLLGYG